MVLAAESVTNNINPALVCRHTGAELFGDETKEDEEVYTGFMLWAILVAGVDTSAILNRIVTQPHWRPTDSFFVARQPLKIDSCFVLPHDTVVCRGNASYPTICDTLRIGNHWLYRVIRGKDSSKWTAKRPLNVK